MSKPWSHAHDEYANKKTVNTRDRTKSIPKKRPQRPKDTSTSKHHKSQTAKTGQNDEKAFKYRGKGGTPKRKKKSNPWSHAHDEYNPENPKYSTRERSSSPHSRKKSNSHTKHTNDNNNLRSKLGKKQSDNSNKNGEQYNNEDPEEKSNIPINAKKPHHRRRPQKPNTQKRINQYVNASNIHQQQYRSGYRGGGYSKPLPNQPDKYINHHKHGKEQFNNILKEAAAAEGLDVNNPQIKALIQGVGDQMGAVSGFDNFLRHKDGELEKMVKKQETRRKQYDKISRNHQGSTTSHHSHHNKNIHIETGGIHHNRKGSVKEMTARWEMNKTNRNNRRMGGNNYKNPALQLPTQRHRRRVSSQYSIGQLAAVIGSHHAHSPGHLNDNSLLTAGGDGGARRLSLIGDRFPDTDKLTIDLSDNASVGSIDRNSLVMTDVRDNKAVDIEAAVAEEEGDDNPIFKTIKILSIEPKERTDKQVEHLVRFFEDYQIMTEDVDTWSGQATFREFIRQTRYKHVKQGKYIFVEGDDGDEFYLVLEGAVSVLVDKTSGISQNDNKKNKNKNNFNLKNATEIHVVQKNDIFGEIAMFNQGKRSATCIAKIDTDLAYWDRATYDEFIRPMKELRHKAQKILKDKSGGLLSDDQLIEKAAMFLDDAMHGRELKMHRNGPWPRRIHKLINHKYFNYCLVMVSVLLLALIFIEPPSYVDSNIVSGDINNKYYYRILPLLAFEWFVWFIFCGECLLRFYSFGRSWFFTIDLHIWRCIFLFIFFSDLCITSILGGYSFRFSRIIRPFFCVLYIRDLRRQYYIVLSCIPYVIELIILYFIVSAIFARIAYHIFYHIHDPDGIGQSIYMKNEFYAGDYPYNQQIGTYCSNALLSADDPDCAQLLPDLVWSSWDTFFKSMLSLFVLLTTENYPEVWWPSWLSNDGHSYWTFFLFYALIMIFFMMNLFSAAVYDAYQHIQMKLDVLDEKRETAALKVAWICLDTGESGNIGYQKFENLMYRLKPEYTEFQIGVLFRLLDPDGNRLIDAEEFSVMMINILYLSISRKTRSKEDELKIYLQKLGASCPYGYEILRLFDSNGWRYAMLLTQSLDVCVLLSYHVNPEVCNYIDVISVSILLLGLLSDIIIDSMASLKNYFSSTKNRLYFALTCIQTIGTCIGAFNDREWLSALRFFGILRIIMIGMFALEKLKFLRTNLTRTLTQTVIFMIPVFIRIVVHIAIVLMYLYVVVGLELFVPPEVNSDGSSNLAEYGQSRCYPDQQILSNPYALFCDANMAIITLFQILTTNNWHIVMYEAIFVTNNWFVSIYFVSFFFLGPILTVSLLLAMFFNMFFGVSMQSEDALSEFFHETDEEAKNLKEHMELQKARDELQKDNNYISLPKEIGISELPDGQKILTIRRTIKAEHNGEDNGDGEDNQDNQDEEEKAEKTELVHIPIKNIARQIWEHLPGEDYSEKETKAKFENTFNGKQATDYILASNFAPDGEDAVDLLSLIMDEEGAFRRIDTGKENEFENDADAHYQWIVNFNNMMMEEDDIDDNQSNVALEDILIGFRHSYGGYQRKLQQYRQAGIDPQMQAIQQAQLIYSDEDAEALSPVTSLSGTNKNTADENNKPTITEHIRQTSEKILLKLKKTESSDKDNEKNEKNKIVQLPALQESIVTDDTKHNHVKNASHHSDKGGGVQFNSSSSLMLSTSESFRNDKKKRDNKGSVELSVKKSQSTKVNPFNKEEQPQFKRVQTVPIKSNESDDQLAPLQSRAPHLKKSQSILQTGKLKSTVSSKNILLRHLDQKQKSQRPKKPNQ